MLGSDARRVWTVRLVNSRVGFEQMSIRQEAKQELIKESVDIDSEHGVATARLPFIMNPEEKLSNNRLIAKKRLDAICRKYKDDPETRSGILKAWEKFRMNGHLMFHNELEQAMISYWIPWKMVFKDSISTLVRIVFDASTETSSGFSLNDCLAKGTPSLVMLLSMLLEWYMGSNPLFGDISQLYPTMNLVLKHWRFQHILLRHDLNPDGQLLEAVIGL